MRPTIQEIVEALADLPESRLMAVGGRCLILKCALEDVTRKDMGCLKDAALLEALTLLETRYNSALEIALDRGLVAGDPAESWLVIMGGRPS